ncbi:MAG: FMN-binding protein [Planctomycetota bacterium]|jgi:electron transport complex protein RnfG
MSKIKYFIEQSWLLIIASFCFGLLIAIANAGWSPMIEANRIKKLNDSMKDLLPAAVRFESEAILSIKTTKGDAFESNLFKGLSDVNDCIGWAFQCRGPGFQDKIELVVAVDKDFENFQGFSVLFSNETPGFGDKIKLPQWQSQFSGAPAEVLQLVKIGDVESIDSEIVAISGATVSSDAVVKLLNNCVAQVKNEMINKGLIHNGQ